MINDEILERIKLLEIDCPECECMNDDEQYQCSTCGREGGGGRINVYRYLTQRAPDAGDSTDFSGILTGGSESTSQTVTTPAQRPLLMSCANTVNNPTS